MRWLLSGDAALAQAFGQLPMSFQPNEGQTDPQVSFMSQGSGYSLFLTPTESVLSLQTPTAPAQTRPEGTAPDSVLSMHLVGASRAAGRGAGPVARHEQLFHRQRPEPVAHGHPELRPG